MSIDHTSTPLGVSSPPPTETYKRFHGCWLLLARVLWMAIFILTLVVFYIDLLVGHYGLLVTIPLVANTSVWFTVSLVLFLRKSSDRAILLFSLALVLTPLFFTPHLPGALWTYGVWWVPIYFLGVVAAVTLSFWYTFPDGRFVPGSTRWLALGWIAVSLVPILILDTVHPRNWWLSPIYTPPVPISSAFYPRNWWLSPLYALMRIAFYGSIALVLLYRYRQVSTPVQRQQIKWVVFATTIFIIEVIVVELAVFVVPSYFPALGLLTQLYQPSN